MYHRLKRKWSFDYANDVPFMNIRSVKLTTVQNGFQTKFDDFEATRIFELEIGGWGHF